MCVYINKKTKKQKKTTTAAGKKIMRVKIKPWGRLVFFFFFFFFFLKKKGVRQRMNKNYRIGHLSDAFAQLRQENSRMRSLSLLDHQVLCW